MALEGELGASFYQVLGVSKDCSEAEIRSAYRKLARKWHPDKWCQDPSHVEEAKARFQQIQEAYSVLSDDTKRAMYDAGVYDAGDDVDGFSDFLDEMATMMAADTKSQSNKEDTFEDLQEMFTKMVNESWFSCEDIQQSEPTTEKDLTMHTQYPLCEINDYWNDGEDECFDDDDDYCTQDNWYSAASIQDHHSLVEEEQGIKYKKPRVCTSKGSGFEIHHRGAFNSYTSPTFVV